MKSDMHARNLTLTILLALVVRLTSRRLRKADSDASARAIKSRASR